MSATGAMPPTPAEIAAYLAGTLTDSRFEEVDRWLANLPPEEQEQVLAGAGPRGGALSGMADELDPARPGAFVPEMSGRRFEVRGPLGSGGMGVVAVLHDAVLDRDVALKRLRPRHPDETLDAFELRRQAFLREAAITARLEHPSIVPVHDLGEGAFHEPSFIMKRLDGFPVTNHVDQAHAGRPLPLSEIASLMLKVAEAIGYAHSRGVVHRDLKPEHVVVGQFGAVSVIDWGMATDARADHRAFRAGTPLWMAPEQFTSASADPRQDVFALGALLMALMTGCPPRKHPNSPDVDLTPLDVRGVEPGLAAVARTCLRHEPGHRYPDGAAVADELKRWLTHGLTVAQRPGLLQRGIAWLRRSPRAVAAIVSAVIIAALGSAGMIWHARLHDSLDRQQVERLATRVTLSDETSVRAALDEVAGIASARPHLAPALELRSRLAAALSMHEHARIQTGIAHHLRDLEHRYRVRGPWATQTNDVRDALLHAGFELTDSATENEASLLRQHELRPLILTTLVRLRQADLASGARVATEAVPRLIQLAAPNDSWAALGRLLQSPQIQGHDLLFCVCHDSEVALAQPETADVLLSLFGPEPRLVQMALARIAAEPGNFWARVILARAAVQSQEAASAERHALVALGAEPASLWPHLMLSYVALARDEAEALLRSANAGLASNQEHVELRVLKAVGTARTGDVAGAQRIIDSLDAAHLQYHLHKPTGHHMDLGVRALIEAGLTVRAADPEIGPLTPHQH